MTSAYEKLVDRVRMWTDTHGTTKGTGAFLLKLQEELGEVTGAWIKEKSHEELAAEIGDMIIVLVAVGTSVGICPVIEGLKKMSVNEKRAGHVNGKGIFVKDGD